jgi:parallel beta-helix repeat protein
VFESEFSEGGFAMHRFLTGFFVTGSVVLSACTNNVVPTATLADCNVLGKIPSPPSTAKRLTDYGAVPDDGQDDTAALEQAIADVKEGEWLVIPKGKFEHDKRLRLKTPGTTWWGEPGAVLHGTNARDMAIMIQANRTSLYNLTLTAKTVQREGAPWESRIAVFDDQAPSAAERRVVFNTIIRGNTITFDADNPNSSSSSAIFLYRAQGFLVADNTVRRSLADGIHITSNSRDGRVLNNTVTQTGDDGIAVVSYSERVKTNPDISSTAANIDSIRDSQLARNVLIQDNSVSDIYWGRGLSVVGGVGVSIIGNQVSLIPGAAGIYLARETSYQSFGVGNVLVRGNTIKSIQTKMPTYDFGGKFARETLDGTRRTRHGGIEIHSHLLEDEAVHGRLVSAYGVGRIHVADNTLSDTLANGLRVGVPTSGARLEQPDGTFVNYQAQSAPISDLIVKNNAFDLIGSDTAINVMNNDSTLSCEGNTDDGAATASPRCGVVSATVTGAQFSSCTIR